MKEFIEKLIGRLEEEKYACHINAEVYTECKIGKIIGIVKELAEKYKNSISSADYDSIIAFIESEIERTPSYAEHYTQISIMDYVQQLKAKNNNGWIPCSVKLPEEDCWTITCDKEGNIHIFFYASGYFRESFGGKAITEHNERFYVPIAWQPLPDPYQQKEGLE